MNKINITSTFFVVMMVQQLAAISLPDYLAPLQAGYGYTQEEKDNACQEIAKLQQEKEDFLVQLNDIGVDMHLSAQEKNEYFSSIVSNIDKIDGDIKELQRITGDVWSENRKYAWGLAGLCGATFLTYKFGPSILAFVKLDSNSNKLKKLEEEKCEKKITITALKKQLSDLQAQNKIDKEQVKKLTKLEKKEKELEKLVAKLEQEKLVQENKRKEAQRKDQEKQEEIAQKKIEAQKNVDIIKQEINECIIKGQSDSDADKAEIIQLNEKLKKAQERLVQLQSNAELYDYKEKERKEENRKEMAARYQKFLDEQKKERQEIRREIMRNILQTSITMAKKTVNWVVKETPVMIAAGRKYFKEMRNHFDSLTDFERDLLLINISFP